MRQAVKFVEVRITISELQVSNKVFDSVGTTL